MERVIVEARCKVNLALEVIARREDGYHEIDTVFQTVTLSDSIELRPAAGAVSVEVPGGEVAGGPGNLAARAARAVMRATGCPGVSVTLLKRIPVGAGLGGGSADAAGVIVGLNALYGLGLEGPAMREIGLEAGSDVPFLVEGGTVRGRGRGEALEQLPELRDVWFVLATPGFEVSAGSAYDAVRFGLTKRMGFTKLVCSAIRDRDVLALGRALQNDLEPGVVRLHPEVGQLATRLRERGALGVVMSGSGPTVVALARLREEAEEIAASLGGFGGRVHVVEPARAGCVITQA